MPDYQLSKIYKLVNDINDKIYIGSSTYPYLSSRLSAHHQMSKDTTGRRNSVLYNFMREIGIEHFKIELIEKYPCNNRQILFEREQYHLDLIKPELNQFRAIEDPDFEKKRQIRDRDKISLRSKEYYDSHKEEIAEKGKLYRETNKIDIQARRKIYRENNKDKILQKYNCECGIELLKKCLSKHLKTLKHCEFINNK